MPILVRRDCVGIDHHWKRGGWFGQFVRPELIVETREQERRGFSGDARYAQNHPRQDSFFRRWNDDRENRARFTGAQGKRAFP